MHVKHSYIKQARDDVISLLLVSVAFWFLLNWLFTSAPKALILVFFITFNLSVIWIRAVKKREDFDIVLINNALIGPSSFANKALRNTINVQEPFTISRAWSFFPFYGVKLNQNNKQVLISASSIGRQKVKQVLDTIASHAKPS